MLRCSYINTAVNKLGLLQLVVVDKMSVLFLLLVCNESFDVMKPDFDVGGRGCQWRRAAPSGKCPTAI